MPRSADRPAPLWQVAAALDPGARQRARTIPPAPLPAAPPRSLLEFRRPQNSAIVAGWVCVGIGLLTAWVFPLANGFFSIAIILSVVAMATHQIRDGLVLLAGSVASLGFSVLLSMLGLAALFVHAVNKVSEIKPLPTPTLTAVHTQALPPVERAARTPVAVTGVVGGAPNLRPVPLTLAEVSAMISAGRGDEEIIATLYSRPLLGRLGASEATTLRAYGASDRLMEVLRARFPADNPPPIYQIAASATPPPMARTPAPTQAPRVVTPAPVDYAARDREIAELDRQINAMDNAIQDFRINHAKMTDYIAQMERTREDLRRRKWAAQGR